MMQLTVDGEAATKQFQFTVCNLLQFVHNLMQQQCLQHNN